MIKNIKCIFSVAAAEYRKWITNPRIVIVGVLIIFMRALAVEPLLERAAKFGERLNIFEPFVGIGNSAMLVMLMPCVFLILISDYPKMTGNSIFFMKRTGRLNWFFGQMLFLIYAINTFLAAVLLGGILVSGGKLGTSWSNTVTKYEARFPNDAGSFASRLLPSNLYNQMTLVSALFHTFILVGVYLFLLSLIIYFFKLIHIQSLGLFASVFVVAAGAVTYSLELKSMWAFPMANTLVWLHYTQILRKQVFPTWASYAYFGVAIALLLTLDIIAAKKLQLYNIELIE